MDRSFPVPQRAFLSEGYRALNAELHSREPSFGTTGRRYVDVVRRLARNQSAQTILDYGCGKRDLSAALSGEFEVRNYDPALPGFDDPPDPADFVACIDVLEHVEPDFLEPVLSDLVRVTIKVAFLTIATRPAGKRLADGSNPHRIVECPAWWLTRLKTHFRVIRADVPPSGGGVDIIAEPLPSMTAPFKG